MRIAGIVIASVGALGLLSLCINGDVYNGLVGGGIMMVMFLCVQHHTTKSLKRCDCSRSNGYPNLDFVNIM